MKHCAETVENYNFMIVKLTNGNYIIARANPYGNANCEFYCGPSYSNVVDINAWTKCVNGVTQFNNIEQASLAFSNLKRNYMDEHIDLGEICKSEIIGVRKFIMEE